MTVLTDNYHKESEEHIMVCLSSAPSNAKIIATAEKMTQAFGGRFTALYQIAEFARISGVTKLVIGRSTMNSKHFWGKTSLTERLIEIAPDIDIHIIRDSFTKNKYREQKEKFAYDILPTPEDLLITTMIAYLCWHIKVTQDSIIAVYILGVFITSVVTRSYGCGIPDSFISVMLFNFLFTEPRFTFHAKEIRSLFAIAIMLIVSLLTATLAHKLKRQHGKRNRFFFVW